MATPNKAPSPLQSPGKQYVQGKDQPVLTHNQARQKIESRTLPGKIYRPKKEKEFKQQSFAAGYASNTAQGTASIVEMARALKSDIDLIHEFVHGNIEHYPTYGLHRGGYGALVDGIGNAWDQADLMVQLLRQASYTANYLFGELDISETDANAWLGTTDIWAARNLLLNGGNPTATVIWTGSEYRLQFSHVWVKAQISSTWYQFDPTFFKTYSTKTGINLATALSFNATTFMSNASSGATIDANSVQNMNRSNIRSDLQTMSMNLVNWIKTNDPDAGLDDIVGGRTINALTPGVRQTAHPKLKSGTTPTEWTAIPDAYKHTLSVYFDGGTIDVSFFSPDVYGKRLTFFYNGSHEAELRLDGTLLGTSSTQTPGGWNSILLSATHPYGGYWADQSVWHRVWTDQFYSIANGWGNAGRGFMDLHGKKVEENNLAGFGSDTDQTFGETLSHIWHSHMAHVSRVSDLINRMTNCTTVWHHYVGLVGHFDTPLFDIGMVTGSSSALDNDYDRVLWNDTVNAMHGVAWEAGSIAEIGDIKGVSTTPVIDAASAAGLKIFDAKSANWSTVRPLLTNYSTQTLDDIENWWINAGYRVALPKDGNQTIEDWQGHGYFALPTSGAYGIIGGGLKGGSGSKPKPRGPIIGKVIVKPKLIPRTPQLDPGGGGLLEGRITHTQGKGGAGTTGKGNPGPGPGPSGGGGGGNTGTPQTPDPIDLQSGAFYCSESDITLGSAPYPHGLEFGRDYISSSRFTDGPLGLGWRHNWQISALVDSDTLLALGQDSPIHGASAICELFVSVTLLSDLSRPHDKLVASALSNQWLIDQVYQNVVRVNARVGDIGAFVRLADGTYAPAVNSGYSLIQNMDGTFKVTSPQQVVYNFNSDRNISTIVHPFGVTITFAYTSGKLTSVTNGLGRTLTLSYTGNYLSSVSDGTGRSVSYVVDGSKHLTQFSNPDSKTTVYSYNSPGQLKEIFYPANPSVAFVTNIYDSLGRVKEQKDGLNHSWFYYIAGSRSEEVNPVGNKQIHYFNNLRLAVRSINGVGQETKKEFDALGRMTKIVFPEGNSTEFTYDLKHNVLTVRNKAKSGSGLSDIVKSYTYHSTYNKVATAVDGLSRTTTFNYDSPTGNLLSVQRPQVGGVTPTVSFTWNSRGQILTATDETGIVTKMTYDTSTEKLLTVVRDFGTGRLNLTTQYSHNSRGDVTSFTDPRGNATTFQFNNRRLMTQKTDPSPLSYVTNFGYNDDGRLNSVQRQTGDVSNPWQTTNIAYTVTGEIQSITNPSGDATSLTYDNADRLWKKTEPVSATENRVWEFAYDADDRLYTVKDPNNIFVETRSYTNNGRIASVSDGRSNQTLFTFDGFDRPNRTTFADSSYEQNVTYDANNNILTRRTRSGNTITFTFDELNRVKTRSPQGQATVTMTYDLAGRMTKASKPVVSGDPSTGDFEFFFDTAGRFWKEQYPDGKIVQHVLDANGNLTKTTWPDTWYCERVYDELNRQSDIKLNGASTAAVHFNWDPLSRRTSTVFENGVTTTNTFELDDDLATIAHAFVGSSVNFTLGYNKAHQIISQQISDGANYMWHPAAGGTTSYGTADSVNKYPTVGGVSHSYDSNGCLTGDGVWTFTFDTENHLLTANKTGTSVTNRYDPVHRQREHQVDSTKNRYIYDGLRLIADYDDTTLLNRYVYGLGIDEILIGVASGGTKTYYHGNHQSSVIAQTNASGGIVNRYKYSPFGESPSMTGTIHGYTGQRYESESGLYYYKLRYYSPKLGRFLQPDPIGFGDGLNLYIYAHNDGLNRSDSFGLKSPPPGNIGFTPLLNGNGILDLFKPGIENLKDPMFDLTIVITAITMNPMAGAATAEAVTTAESIPLITQSATRGRAFQKFFHDLTETLENTGITFRPGGGLPGARPDLLFQNVIVEIKDVARLSLSPQIKTLIETALKEGKKVDLIVSETNKYISGPLREAIQSTGGWIIQVNRTTGASKVLQTHIP